MSAARRVLWWGRFDPDYSRNRVLRLAFQQLGWDVADFRPRFSRFGDLEAYLAKIARPDLVWIPSFRHRDVAAARRWADRQAVPLVFDPLISAYDKQVNERQLLSADSFRARRLQRWEQQLLQAADRVVADTCAHADYFCDDFAVPQEKVRVVPVGAEEGLFKPVTRDAESGTIEALFYGTFIDLQGPQVIVEAAAECKAENVVWTLLGAGPLRSACESLAAERRLTNLRFEDWVPYERLAQRIARADILLGVFGRSDKAGRVIPNKVYQALACGKPVVTRESTAYPAAMADNAGGGLTRISAGDPAVLARTIEDLAKGGDLTTRSEDASRLYDHYFSARVIAEQLQDLLRSVSR